MALYHFTVKVISCGKGQSGVAALAYRAGIKLHDQRIGRTFDYQNKAVQHVEMLFPDHVPDFMKEWQAQLVENRESALQKFSDYLESFEQRFNSQIYREIEFALPHELTQEQNIKLAREFVEHHCVKRGMVAVCNFHFDVDQKTGQSKPHCHVLLSTRSITREGFGLKNRDWNQKDLVLRWRERWAEYVNVALKEHNIEAQVDHRSYADRGIDLEPQLKKSHSVLQRVQKGLESFRYAAFEDIRRRNLFKIQRRPELVLELVSQNHSTFTDKDILRVIGRYADTPEVFSEIQTRVFASPELIKLNDKNKNVYTTRSLIRLEAELIERGQRISMRKTHGVLPQHLVAAKAQSDQELAQYGGLSREQKAAIDHLVTPGRLKTLVGYAGSGKTTALKVAAQAWQETGYKVLGLSPTGRASENLEELGIRAMTLDRYFRSFETGREQYSKGSVFILDEAGMVDSRKMSMLLDIVERQGIKLVMVGDKGQLQAVQAGSPFRILLDRVPPAKLENIIRQRQDWQKQATKLFGKEQSKQALELYRDQGHIKLINEQSAILNKFRQGESLSNVELIQAHLITRRIAGNIFYQIRSDLMHQGISEDKIFAHAIKHPLFPLFQSWKNKRESINDALKTRGLDVVHSARGVSLKLLDRHKGDLDSYRPLAKDDGTFESWKASCFQTALELKSGIIDLRTQTKERMAEDWLQEAAVRKQAGDDSSSLMLAHSNKDVDDLNRLVREKLKKSGTVAEKEVTLSVAKDVEIGIHGTNEPRRTTRAYEDINFAVGDQVIFKKNDNGLKVKNGTLGIISSIEKHKLKVSLKGDDTREVSFSPTLYPHFRHGWAITINASQGTTVDHVKMLASFEETRNLSYVGFTRHRESFQIYGSELEFNTQSLLVDRLSRSHEKLTGLDYSLEADQVAKVLQEDDRLITKIWKTYEQAKDTVNASVHFVRNLFTEPQEINSNFGDGSGHEPERAIKVLGIDKGQDHQQVPEELLYNKQKQKQSQHTYAQGHRADTSSHTQSIDQKQAQEQTHTSAPKTLPTRTDAPSGSYYDVNVMNDLLKGNEEELLTQLLGQKPNASLSTSQEFRFGAKGSFAFKRQGPHAGLWHDFETSEGGNIYTLIKRQRGLNDFKEQLKYVAECYGVAPTQSLQQTKLTDSQRMQKRQQEIQEKARQQRQHLEKRRSIEEMYKRSSALRYSTAEAYLKQHRGLKGPFPESLRYVAHYKNGDYEGPALIGFAKDRYGNLCARQAISLDPNTGNKATIETPKKSFGQVKGHPILIQAGTAESNTIFVAEGIETALSVAQVVPKQVSVWASLGASNFKHLPVKRGQTLVICADNDGVNSKTTQTVAKAAEELRKKAVYVRVIQPRQQGYDFNDVLMKEGELAVQAVLRRAIERAAQEIEHNAQKLKETRLQKKQIEREKNEISRGFCR